MSKRPIPSNIKHQYQNNGYVLIKQLFSEQECDELIERSLALHARKSIPGCFHSVPESESDGDPLRTSARPIPMGRMGTLGNRIVVGSRNGATGSRVGRGVGTDRSSDTAGGRGS